MACVATCSCAVQSHAKDIEVANGAYLAQYVEQCNHYTPKQLVFLRGDARHSVGKINDCFEKS